MAAFAYRYVGVHAPWSREETDAASEFDQAASASSDTRSHVVAWKLARAFMRASQETRLGQLKVNGFHSGVLARKIQLRRDMEIGQS